MTFGSEPRRRRWSSGSSRRAGEARRTSEDEDAENWLAGIRPGPPGDDGDAADAFGTVTPPFGPPPADAPLPADDPPERPARRRRAAPEPAAWSASPMTDPPEDARPVGAAWRADPPGGDRPARHGDADVRAPREFAAPERGRRGRRAAPEERTGRWADPEPLTGRRAGPESGGRHVGPADHGPVPDEPWPSATEPPRSRGGRPSRSPADSGLPPIDPVRPTRFGPPREAPFEPPVGTGRHAPAPVPAPPPMPPIDRPGDQPTSSRQPRAAASASVPVRGTPQPPPAAPEQLDQGPPARGRTAASARVSPPGSARVPPRVGGPPVTAPPGGRFAGGPHPDLDGPWVRDDRRPFDDSDPTHRRPFDDSGPARRRQRPDRPTGRTGAGYPPTPARRTSARSAAGPSARTAATTSVRRGPAAGGERSRLLSKLLGLASVLVLVAVAFGGYLLINGGLSNSPVKRSTAGPVVKPRNISSRDVDQAPLTEQEVFPGQQVTVGTSAYQVLKAQTTDCQTAATGDLVKLLTDLGCSQVVRGTLKSPDSQFLITAGIVNLKDEASADQAYESIKPILDAQKGRFTGLVADNGTEAIVRVPTTLGWHPRGHYLAYCVVARADGKAIAADDPASKQVISDVVEGYLRDTVLRARAVTPAGTPK